MKVGGVGPCVPPFLDLAWADKHRLRYLTWKAKAFSRLSDFTRSSMCINHLLSTLGAISFMFLHYPKRRPTVTLASADLLTNNSSNILQRNL